MLRNLGISTFKAPRRAARKWASSRSLVSGENSSNSNSSRLLNLQRSGLPLDVHEEVKEALEHGRPIVALESAIITHGGWRARLSPAWLISSNRTSPIGLPRPTNLETAQSLERIVRKTGAIPATIAVLDGRLTVGLTAKQLSTLAAGTPQDTKVSRRDLAPILGLGRGKGNGGTTISGTMVVANLVGIKVGLLC